MSMRAPLAGAVKNGNVEPVGNQRHMDPLQDRSTNIVDVAKPVAKVVASYFGGPVGAKAVDTAYNIRTEETGKGKYANEGLANKAADLYASRDGGGSGGGGFDLSALASMFNK